MFWHANRLQWNRMNSSPRTRLAPLFLSAMLALGVGLNACGGGGGSSSGPGIPSTGVTFSPAPSPSPSGSPKASPSPSTSPTIKPSPSTSPTIMPSPSASPSTSPTAGPSPTPTPVVLRNGEVLGVDDKFVPADGDAMLGGQGQPVDGITCGAEKTLYHHHIHLSIYVNGVQYATPDTIGMFQPGQERGGFTYTWKCLYALHTHDASGIIHIEGASAAPYTLLNLFDIWGQTLMYSDIAGFNGQVQIYIATAPAGSLLASNYVQYTGPIDNIAFGQHDAIALEVGPPYIVPPYIPAIKFPY